jgi:hypothetical protein
MPAMSAQILRLDDFQRATPRPATPDAESALVQACRRLLESFDALGERAGAFESAVTRLQDRSRDFGAARTKVETACAPLRTLVTASAVRFD